MRAHIYQAIQLSTGINVDKYEANRSTFNALGFEVQLTCHNSAASYAQHWDKAVSSVRLSWDTTGDKSTYLWSGVSQSFRAPNIADLSRYGASRSTEFEVAKAG